MIPSFFWSLSIFCWQDLAEIFIIFSGILYLSFWFKKDTHKPLLLWLYSYITIFLASDSLCMTTLSTGLATFAPAVCLLVIFIHKETLQKNFIALHSIKSPEGHVTNWQEILIQSTLFASNKTIGMTCVIEKNDALSNLTHKGAVPLNATLSKDLLQLIITSPLYQEHLLLILSNDGRILSINDFWEKNSIELWLTKEVQEQAPWIQDGIFFTSKTDAFIFQHDPSSRTYTAITQGKVVTNITAAELIKRLCMHLSLETLPHTSKGRVYGNFTQKSSIERSLS